MNKKVSRKTNLIWRFDHLKVIPHWTWLTNVQKHNLSNEEMKPNKKNFLVRWEMKAKKITPGGWKMQIYYTF